MLPPQNTPQVAAGYVLHIADVTQGALAVGDGVTVAVDYARRDCIAPNHTFTHVLNFGLRCAAAVAASPTGLLAQACPPACMHVCTLARMRSTHTHPHAHLLMNMRVHPPEMRSYYPQPKASAGRPRGPEGLHRAAGQAAL